MQRYALKIEYHGAPFVGWQRQIDLASVQGAIEDALAKIEPRAHNIAAAGRTDAGVHALAQVAHCDMERDWTPFRLSEAINYHLKPLPIAIVDCVAVDDDFHARFSALERRYLFRVLVRRPPATHQAGLVWQVKKPLDIDRMREAATHLIGEHDFTTFRSTICQAQTPVKTLDRVDMTEHPVGGGVEVQFDVRARSFLHNQVRSIVGTLERVGAGSFAPDDVKQMLAARDRQACGPVAPPQGLYLSHVTYETDPFAQSPLRRG
ncbi:MAG: tRNA pseudouridine(38-40) synthase TruA [Roseobacter sp.]|jgi:tRNA pseudouridine38-40 synthase|uniref:tRNA pseudouridine synthase A n=2 Tax=Sulfitobacter pontiacus TaxID=60137 RepID=A0A1H2XX21_9RHOB|nr:MULTISPECIES: tRNA pseudouridine(38-40) synthase TruA [Sulfitobacter]MBG62238.1 tRNA pseudouridine(38-40) synthase TruA [Roseobacter sp.]QPO09509.1 tRNA pseudouridine(38-40) synthase TruA [Sulfitobacter sp. B30-2]UWR19731.1 tRNA pseudouridine(38-40) synthase TruA [Sulfitobacter pontiacus]SDW97370.1 tRNA pseudouridine38-40 synthase [Sulfitobacter pontiacus]|tara:strand:- start:1020 stop:1808 length:789 start_codon:yes stop_codon:yes gene_type:complete